MEKKSTTENHPPIVFRPSRLLKDIPYLLIIVLLLYALKEATDPIHDELQTCIDHYEGEMQRLGCLPTIGQPSPVNNTPTNIFDPETNWEMIT